MTLRRRQVICCIAKNAPEEGAVKGAGRAQRGAIFW